MLKEAWKIEKDEMKGEKKKLEYALFDLVKAHNAKRELLKKMKQILDESEQLKKIKQILDESGEL